MERLSRGRSPQWELGQVPLALQGQEPLRVRGSVRELAQAPQLVQGQALEQVRQALRVDQLVQS